MILGTILESKSIYTSHGRQYRVQWDKNPSANSMDGLAGTALSSKPEGAYAQGDRVQLAYISDMSCGLWYVLGKV